MAENLHKDNFEDFLKKSFEDYDDSPSDDLWGKIEGQMVKPPAGIGYYFRKWWLAGVAALLLGIIICQYVHYNSAIEELTVQLENQKTESVRQSGDEERSAPSNISDRENQVKHSQTSSKPTPPAKSEEFYQQRPQPESKNAIPQNPGEENGETGKSPPIAQENTSLLPENLNTATGLPKEESGQIVESTNKDDENRHVATREVPGLTMPPTLSTRPLMAFHTVPQAVFLPAVDAGVAYKKGKFSVGANYLTMNSKEQISTVRIRNRPTGRMIFNANRSSGSTVYAGLQAERRFANGLALQTGLGYRKTTTNTDHRAKLRFMDRVHSGTSTHDFVYDLNTATGLVEVEVRAEQTDPAAQIANQEPINIFIRAEQQLEYVTVPLLLKYQVSDHRLHINAKAGLLGNILAREQLTIKTVNLLNDKFRTRTEAAKLNDLQELKRLTLDLAIGLELEFDLTPQWSVGLAPTYITSISGNHNDRFVDSTDRSVGLNLGTMYHF